MKSALQALFLCAAALLSACQSPPERLLYSEHESPAMGGLREYSVYLPPGASEAAPETLRNLPLVLFLHGGGDTHRTLDRYEVGQDFDAAIDAGELPPFIMIVPRGDMGFWTNWDDGSRLYEDWILDELLPHARRRFDTRPCPEACHVMGISMGGIGSLRFALHRPGLFASMTSISGPVLDSEQMVAFGENFWARVFMNIEGIFGPADDLERIAQDDVYLRWTSPEDLAGTWIGLAWGDSDRPGLAKTNRRLSEHLTQHGIAHAQEEFPGGHNWKAWKPVFVRNLSRVLSARPSD